MDDEFDRYFMNVLNKVMNALSSGAMGIKISISPDGDVRIDQIGAPKRKIYVPFEVVDAGDSYLLTLDLRRFPLRAVTLKLGSDGVVVNTPNGERFIYFDEKVDPDTASYELKNGVVELMVKKGKGGKERIIRFPQ
jgi:HSP20 family molecular chaperone IbpA